MAISTIGNINSKTKGPLVNDVSENKSAASVTSTTPTPIQKPSDPDTLNASASYNVEGVTFINNEAKDFSSCKFTLNQDYKYKSGSAYSVTSGQQAALNFADFTKKDGTRFNVYQIKPQYLYAQCDRKDGGSGFADIFWD